MPTGSFWTAHGIENEHVIGNVFYIQRPKKAITVPSCSACNRGRGDGGVCDLHLDEEYMRTILCMAEGCAAELAKNRSYTPSKILS
jgi:hypothetical protein